MTLCRSVGQTQMNQKVIKADLHGCLITGMYDLNLRRSVAPTFFLPSALPLPAFSPTVEKSKCPSYVGVHGIVLQETQNTFKLISREDRLKSKLSPLYKLDKISIHSRQILSCIIYTFMHRDYRGWGNVVMALQSIMI